MTGVTTELETLTLTVYLYSTYINSKRNSIHFKLLIVSQFQFGARLLHAKLLTKSLLKGLWFRVLKVITLEQLDRVLMRLRNLKVGLVQFSLQGLGDQIHHNL